MRDEYTIIEEIRSLVCDVNCNEIAAHFNEDRLFNWTGVWRTEVRDRLNELEQMLNDREVR